MLPPNQIYFALIITLFCTFAMTFLEIHRLANTKPKCVFYNFNFWLYFSFQLFGNLVATLLAAYLLKDKLPDDLNDWQFLIFSFIGIFAFWGVFRHSNINLLNAKVLTFQDWTNKAKDLARQTATKNKIIYYKKEKMEISEKLKDCKESDIDFHLFHKDTLTPLEKQQLMKDIKNCIGDKKLYKCMELVSRDIDTAKMIIKTHEKELSMTKKTILELDE